MHRHIAPFLLLALVTTLAACDDPTAPSAPFATPTESGSLAAARVLDRVSVTAPFFQIASSNCLAEETLTISGTFHEEFISLAIPGDPQPYHYELTDVVRGTAIGSSGAEYKFLFTEHQTLSLPNLESAHSTFSFPGQNLLIGKGGAPNLVIHFTEHTTYLPSGELQVSLDEIRVTCQNR